MERGRVWREEWEVDPRCLSARDEGRSPKGKSPVGREKGRKREGNV